MLGEILKQFRKTEGPLDLDELSRKLGTDRSALQGMLETLVRQGKLREVRIGSETCAHCGKRGACAYVSSGGMMGTVYEIENTTDSGGE